MFRHLNPPRILVLSFLGIILLGAVLLRLPAMQNGQAVGMLDCLFTSASAVCVTGLITVDTATAWSPLGQGLILLLIQLGGLGIMTFSVAFIFLMGRRHSPVLDTALHGAFGSLRDLHMGHVARDILAFTLLFEAVGAGLLFLRFQRDFEASHALGLAVFHSVSAFCNAGFSLFTHSLERYATDPLVNGVVLSLIVFGGMGFFVMREVAYHLRSRRRRPRRWSLHTRLVVITILVLTVGGAALMGLFEYVANGGAVWRGSFWPLLFTALTPRTAGFNTIPLLELSNASLLVIMLLMFIGASPGSCGGGVKTTTAALIFMIIKSRLQGRTGARAFGRAVPETQQGSALSLVLGSALVLCLAIMALLSLDLHDAALGKGRDDLILQSFEAISAFGTVGLSLDLTPRLSPWGKGIVMCLMLLGRVGPLTFIYSLAKRVVTPRCREAEESIMVG